MIVVTQAHERFYAGQAVRESSSPLLMQPCNRGTAPASELDPEAIVGFFRSHHYFTDDEAFVAHVNFAYEAAEFRFGEVVLLGVVPSGPEVDYGWIEPGVPLETHASGSVFRVRRFWEMPTLSLASALMAFPAKFCLGVPGSSRSSGQRT